MRLPSQAVALAAATLLALALPPKVFAAAPTEEGAPPDLCAPRAVTAPVSVPLCVFPNGNVRIGPVTLTVVEGQDGKQVKADMVPGEAATIRMASTSPADQAIPLTVEVGSNLLDIGLLPDPHHPRAWTWVVAPKSSRFQRLCSGAGCSSNAIYLSIE